MVFIFILKLTGKLIGFLNGAGVGVYAGGGGSGSSGGS